MKKVLINTAMLSILAAPVCVLAEEGSGAPDDARLDPGQTVADREQPEFEPLGIRAGSFLFFPEVRLSETYDDNLFYQDVTTSDDFVTSISPSARLVSDWSNHLLEFSAKVESVRHADYSDENMDNYSFFASGRLDVSRDTRIGAKASWERDHEGRGSPNAVNGKEPTPTDTGTVALSFEHEPGRVFLRGGVSFADRSFDNVETSVATVINNADRNRKETEFTATVGYEIQPQYATFLRYTRDDRNYDDAVDDNGFNRDSSGNNLQAGLEVDLSGLVTGDVALGYMKRNYDDAAFSDTNSWSMDTNIYWQVTPLSTVILTGSRKVAETTTNASSGFILTSLGVRVVHELRRNLILDASLTSATHEYEGINRDDDLIDFSFGATYDVTREVFLGASYEHNQRDAGVTGLDYDRNAVMVYVGLRR